jgi:hypothetical protein
MFGKKKNQKSTPASAEPPSKKLAPPPAAEVREIEVQSEARDRLRLQHEALKQIKIAIGDLSIRIREIQAQRDQMINSIHAGYDRYSALVALAAAELGIDVDDPTYAGAWLFSAETSKFIRSGPSPIKLDPERKDHP